jgi:predicted nucleotidyltransferase
MDILPKYSKSISGLCEKHKVRTLYAFGSILTDRFNDKSDVDLLVDFHPLDVSRYADNYYDLKFSLEDLFKRHVDLLEDKAIKNPFFKDALYQQRRLVYG